MHWTCIKYWIKKFARTLWQKETADRSRSLMLFGLKEDKGEFSCNKVGQVMLEFGEKRKIEDGKIGLNIPKDKKQLARPV